MPIVHEAVDVLIARSEITPTWKSVVMNERAGLYRITARIEKARGTDWHNLTACRYNMRKPPPTP